jgi:hypothetical protein
MGRRRTDNPGITADNKTARGVTIGFRNNLAEDREIEQVYLAGRFPHIMSLERFRSLWFRHSQAYDDHVVVVDQRGREHSFPKTEIDRAWGYAARVIDFLYSDPANLPPDERSRRRPRR